MNRSLIIAAGGSGKRMEASIPKQFLSLLGIPVMMHTIRKFHEFDPNIRIVVVLPEAHIPMWEELQKKHSFTVKHETIVGGETRFHSVKNGLAVCDKNSIIAVHDAVRPLVSHATIERCFACATEKGNAIPVIAPADSVRLINNNSSCAIDRDTVRLVQTPQVFSADILMDAYDTTYRKEFTDDAGIAEHTGYTIHLTEGNKENIKITTPLDLILAEKILETIM